MSEEAWVWAPFYPLHTRIQELKAENQKLRDELETLRSGEVEIRLDELPRRQPQITTMRVEVSDE